jgi:hypothetical protein
MYTLHNFAEVAMYAWLHFEGLYYSTVATGEFPFQIF